MLESKLNFLQRHLNLPVPGNMISKAQTEPIQPLRSFTEAFGRDLKGWWQMVVNSQDVLLSPLPWSWGKPKKQQKYNNIATTHLHSCTPKRGSYARAQVTSHYCKDLTYHKRIWKDSNVLDGPFGSRTLHLSHQQYPMYLWMLIHK